MPHIIINGRPWTDLERLNTQRSVCCEGRGTLSTCIADARLAFDHEGENWYSGRCKSFWGLGLKLDHLVHSIDFIPI